MFKNSKFLISVFMVGVSLTSMVQAQKSGKKEVERGPMDKYITRSGSPKLVIAGKKKAATRVAPYSSKCGSRIRTQSEKKERAELEQYLLALAGYTEGLTPLQKAWLIKNQ